MNLAEAYYVAGAEVCSLHRRAVRELPLRRLLPLSIAMERRLRVRWSAPLFVAQPRVEDVADAVAEHVEGEDGEEDGDAGTDAHPPEAVAEVGAGVVDVRAPGGRRRLGAEAEETETRLGKDGEGDAERRLDDQRVEDVRQDVPEGDARLARARRAGRLDVLALLRLQGLGARQAGGERGGGGG